ncbi:MAG: hypothetical protein COA42_10590 [Alteromonadaceae bacterium]|nr:MAG: hypothetical protein COA42_10590 [Alteromonadaceae bacterium]
MKRILLASALLATSSIASANDYYVGIDASLMNVEVSAPGFSFSEGANPSAIKLRFGTKFNKYVGLEASYGTGLSSDEVENTRIDIELKNSFSIQAVGFIPISDSFRFSGKLGVARVEFEDNDGDKADADGVFLGVGLAYDFSEKVGLNLELVKYSKGEYDDFNLDVDPTALNLGLNIYF